MWYVVQVRAGLEERIRVQCQKKILPDILQRCFIPYYEEKRRIRGEWITQKRILFPGYIFVVTDRLEELYEKLKTIIGLTRLIGTGRDIVPLTEEEIRFLECLGGPEQVVAMSEGIIEGTTVIIHSGPLMGKEGLICKIDRHKRRAWLKLQMFGREQKVQVGLDIISKTNF